MSGATVRAALVEFFTNPQLPGVERIYQDLPFTIQAGTLKLAANGGWGAVAYLHIDTDQESRISVPVETGKKQVDYVASLIVIYQFLVASGQAEDAWVGPLDTLIDEIKDRIRSDPTAGTADAGPIWQMGQNQGDIRITRDLPTLDPNRTRFTVWTQIQVDLIEIITA